MDQGLVLRGDSAGNLYGKREGQSRIFHYKQGTTQNPVKMERSQETLLFSYQEYVYELVKAVEEKKFLPTLKDKRLFVGNPPNTIESEGKVSLTIIPECVGQIRKEITGADGSSLVFFSNPNDVDKIIKNVETLNLN